MYVLLIPVSEFGFAVCSPWCPVDELLAAALWLDVRALDLFYAVSGHPRSLLGRPELAAGGNHHSTALTQPDPEVRGLVLGCPRFVSVGDRCSAVCRLTCQSLSAGCFPGAAVPCWVKKCSSVGARGRSGRTTQSKGTLIKINRLEGLQRDTC